MVSKSGWGRVASLGVVLSLIALGVSSSPANAAGAKITVRMEEPFEINGHVYPAGLLSMRNVADYNPTLSMDEICVGSSCLGIKMARRDATDTPVTHDAVLFERNSEGLLVLSGYVLRNSGRGEQHRFENSAAQPLRAGSASGGPALALAVR